MTLYYLDAGAWVKRYYQEIGTAWVDTLFDPRQTLACASIGMGEIDPTEQEN